MSKLVFLAHLPLLRMEEEEAAFGEGSLWRLPFDIYDELSAGAFSDHRKDYEATAPVFYRVDMDLDLPMCQPMDPKPTNVAELKIPSNNYEFLCQLGLEFIYYFHEHRAERARSALLLAAPAAGLPMARLSATFVEPADLVGFKLGNQSAGRIRVQGDADQEYLFLPELSGSPISPSTIKEAAGLLPLVDSLKDQPELLAALTVLLDSNAPVLSSAEQLTLNVMALEALLLPEVRSGLGATLAHRVSTLLAANKEHAASLIETARGLYDARSAGLHGETPRSPEKSASATAEGHAQQLLAATIRRLAEGTTANRSLSEQCAQLDRPPVEFNRQNPELPLMKPTGLCKQERLLRSHSPMVGIVASGADMSAPKGSTVSWSPLIGLETTDAFPLRLGEEGLVIMPLSGAELVSMEERDTRRDFIAQLHLLAQPASVIMTGTKDNTEVVSDDATAALLRRRDLAVTALRLAGFSDFYDPALLGAFVYHGSLRTRFPSVLRQTIEQDMRNEAKQRFEKEDAERVASLLALLCDYESAARHQQIDHVLTLFRRGFDRRFLPPVARAGLLLAALEGMLGRFRPPKDRVQLEHLVVALAGKDALPAKWFAKHGRRFRNSVAHGHWRPEGDGGQPVEHLLELVRLIIPAFVRTWLDQKDRKGDRPGRVLIQSVESTFGRKRTAHRPRRSESI
jgi:hypothetical protein